MLRDPSPPIVVLPLPDKLLLNPVPRTMRLQRSGEQNQRDGGMRIPRGKASLDCYLRQRPCRPMCDLQADARRITMASCSISTRAKGGISHGRPDRGASKKDSIPIASYRRHKYQIAIRV